jgi:spore coat polysaccharide biosynthesis protein SpsF
MSSSRLPGKILEDIAGKPMLTRVHDRVSRARTLDEVIVATTVDSSDDTVEQHCSSHGIRVFRGSLYDVLDRFHEAALLARAEAIVRITADCPFIDAALIDVVVNGLLERNLDFACNRLPPPWRRTFPIGLDTEVCTFAALARAWREAQLPQEREHVMPFLYERVRLERDASEWETGTSASGFRVGLLQHVPDCGGHRWTVDTAEDLQFVRQVYARLQGRDDFEWQEVLNLVEAEPALRGINAGIRHNRLEDVDRRGLV